MQTVTPTARVRVTLRLTTVYYGQATFKMSILVHEKTELIWRYLN